MYLALVYTGIVVSGTLDLIGCTFVFSTELFVLVLVVHALPKPIAHPAGVDAPRAHFTLQQPFLFTVNPPWTVLFVTPLRTVYVSITLPCLNTPTQYLIKRIKEKK